MGRRFPSDIASLMSTLHDRLQRLRRPEALSGPRLGLEQLEQELLGTSAELGPLKERLERLVAVAAARGGARSMRRESAPPLEELVQGLRVENERGEFFLIEEAIPLDVWHGDVSLSRFHAVASGTVGILTAEPELQVFDLLEAVVLDTETTGLAGGAGTAAFLVGVGYLEGDCFRVRQYFMRDYHEEPALLRALAGDLEHFSRIVTFNGKMFDLPLLEARFRLNRDRFPLSSAPHLDLLFPARRLWKARLESCRLQSLEAELLGLRRHGDVPGEMIPQVYFDYLRSRDARALARVFRHNRDDIVSLAALSLLACQWVEEGRAEDPRDVLSLARVLERARLYERSRGHYRRAAEQGTGALRTAALLGLAARAKRAGDHDEAAGLWAAAAESGEPSALQELAMDHEHRRHDPEGALLMVERALALLDRRDDPRSRRLAAAFWHRRTRLLRRLRARPGKDASRSRCSGTPGCPG
jgi:uncharacterized protein